MSEPAVNETLLGKLRAYGESDMYPLHMPGHKRRLAPRELESVIGMDITEIEGFDNLHDARGVLKEAQEYAARVYGSEETSFVINGSSAGLLAAITAACRQGGKIMAARNCHRSVYNAIEIDQLEPVYIYPHINSSYGISEGISGQDAARLLAENEGIQAIVLPSPTFDGVVSDIGGICRAAHAEGIPVIVDEAHGAHLHFSGYFPKSALEMGADIVIQSVHKTLPALTQASIIHMNGPLVDRVRLRRMLTVFQSSSPSYLLMGSIDGCMHMLSESGGKLYEEYTEMLDSVRRSLGAMKNLHLFGEEDLEYCGSIGYDRSKLLVSSAGTPVTGDWIYRKLLDSFHIQMEMEAADYVLGITAVGDDRKGLARVRDAFLEIDSEAGGCVAKTGAVSRQFIAQLPAPKTAMSIYEAGLRKCGRVSLEDAPGRIMGDYIYLYPPGIPLITPGEQIDEEAAAVIRYWLESGMRVTGVDSEEKICVIDSQEACLS